MLSSRYIRIQILIILALLLTGSAVQAQQSLSSSQKERLKSALVDMKRKTDHEREVLRNTRMDLFLAYQKYDMDERRIKMLQAQISESQLKLLNVHLDNQLEIRDILNESQFNEFVSMMRKQMGGGHGGAAMFPYEDAAHDKYPDAAMVNNLKLGSDQRKRIQPLIGVGKEKARILEKLRKDAKQMIESYSKYDLDTAAAKKLIASMHQSQEDLASLSFKRQQALRQILTKDQFERMMGMISQKLREHRKPVRRR